MSPRLTRPIVTEGIDVVESQLVWFAAAGGVVIGLVLGYVLTRSASRRELARVQQLESDLASARSEHAQYRSQVSQHFGETTRRLHDLTLQYRAVYEHLADGARTLCPEGAIAIAPSLAEAALPEEAGAQPAADDADQLDLALDAPAGWKPEHGDGDALGPILDEETPPPPTEAARTA